jgi:sugar (pentulose or hexulose) kinase
MGVAIPTNSAKRAHRTPASASPRRRLVAGLDLGSTNIKVLVADDLGEELATLQVRTPWQAGPGGTAQLSPDELLDAVRGILNAAAQRTVGPIEAIAVSGMGETGVLLDRRGEPVAPAFAWFDPRGGQQAAGFPAAIRAEFAGRTGLPLGAQVSVAKLAFLKDQGVRLAGLRWLNLPEFVAMSLGGGVALEHSLTSRTGLIDQDTDEPWPAILDLLGADEGLLPPRLDAGALWGHVTEARAMPRALWGAALTVAGHDHLVGAQASDADLPTGHYYVSMGTAEVLLRVIDAPLGFDARSRLAGHLINEVRHVVAGKRVLVAGVKSGLLLRRALQAVGVDDKAGRDRIDAAVMALPYEGMLPAAAIEVAGARNDDGVLRLALHGDGASPAEIFGAVLRHSNAEIATLIDALDRELPAATSATLTGGWAGMACVQRARARVLPQMSLSDREQETAYGAARTAAGLLATPRL